VTSTKSLRKRSDMERREVVLTKKISSVNMSEGLLLSYTVLSVMESLCELWTLTAQCLALAILCMHAFIHSYINSFIQLFICW